MDSRDSTTSSRGSVQFGSVEIREFNRVLGEHVEICSGLSLGWEYSQQDPRSLEEFEDSQRKVKMQRMKRKQGSLRGLVQYLKGSHSFDADSLPMLGHKPLDKRMKILKGFGYSHHELRVAEKARLQKLYQECMI